MTVCSGTWFDGDCRTHSAAEGARLRLTGTPLDRAVSSLEIRPQLDRLFDDYDYHANYPDESDVRWSEQTQGISHDDRHWYISNRFGIYKFPVSDDIDRRDNAIRTTAEPDGCDHVGDITYHDGFIYAAVEDCPHGEERLYKFDSDLRIVAQAALVQRRAPWVAVHPFTGRIYSSLDETQRINVYTEDIFAAVLPLQKEPLRQIELDRRLPRIQGGVFSRSGLLYLSVNDEDHPNRAGIHVFKIEGSRARHMRHIGTNGFDPLDVSELQTQEVEGLTIWDVDGLGAPGIPRGHIHWVLLYNGMMQGMTYEWDDVTVKHLSVDDPGGL